MNNTPALPIVERADQDLTLEEAAWLAGRSAKTLRRAVHSGGLPRRYVLGPRGPQLMFEQPALRSWIATLVPAGRATISRDGAHSRAAPRDIARMIATLAQLHRALQDNQAMLAQLAARLRDQEGTMVQAQLIIDYLVRKLGERRANGAADTL